MTSTIAQTVSNNAAGVELTRIARVRPLVVDVFVLGGGLLYLATVVFEGPLRFLLNHLGLEGMLYLRDGVLLQTFVFALVLGFPESPPIRRLFFGLTSILLLWSVISLNYVSGFMQTLVGWKVFIPLLVGIIAYERLQTAPAWLRPVAIALFLVTAVAVILNSFVRFPWEGLSYNVGDVEVEATREWTAFGVRRLAGFARSSFDAAMLSLFLGVIVVATIKNRLLAAACWILAGASIALTTTKGVSLAYLVVTIFFLTKSWLPWARPLFKFGFLCSIVLMILLPMTSAFVRWDSFGSDDVAMFFLSSFWARLTFTWPDALALVNQHGDFVFGRGLGGIGFPQALFEPWLYNPADNTFIYFYADFGAMAFLLFAVLVWRVLRAPLAWNAQDNTFFALILALGVYGIFCNMVEAGVASLVIGATLARFFCVRPVKKDKAARLPMGSLNQGKVPMPPASLTHGAKS